MRRSKVVMGFLGTVLDAGQDEDRWERWRPTVSLCQHEELLIDRLEIFHQPRSPYLLDTVVSDIGQISPETEVRCHPMEIRNPWDFEEVYAALHDFAVRTPFDPENEEYLVQITTGTHVAQICLFLLVEAHYLPGKLLQLSPPTKRGRSRGLVPGSYHIIDLDLSRYDRLASRFQQREEEGTSFLKSGIATRNKTFNRMIMEMEEVAIHSRMPVLLMGPTGARKSLLARRIYELKKRRHQVKGAFVEVNCATLRGDGAMSALFGHRTGAFTGAVKDRPGLLKQADGGLLFLDEIGELGLDEQAMILRAIEEGRYLPVGADQEVESQFQLLAGTNRDLQRDVVKGRFREDLLARLDLWTYRLPGLAERREDIEPNIEYELRRFAQKSGQRVTFNREAWDLYLKFALSPEALWSANFRDLGASITRMATFAKGGRIRVSQVMDELARLRHRWQGKEKISSSGLILKELIGQEIWQSLDPFDRVQLAEVVQVCRQSKNLSDAGRKLFAVSRLKKKSPNDADRLRKYLQRFDLTWLDINP
ncbi:RNA repair transcriptional activator RtcR [Magnetococcales bacterium HHB-1]